MIHFYKYLSMSFDNKMFAMLTDLHYTNTI